MADFETAFRYLMTHEDDGLTGTVTHDDGGATRWGISQKAYPNLDISNLSLADAEAIYRRDYWEPIMGGALTSQRVASKLLDMAVNMGVGRAVRMAQAECVRKGQPVLIDSCMGPKTVAAINAVNGNTFAIALAMACEMFYAQLVNGNPKFQQYRDGWMARGHDLPPAEEA